MRKTLCEVCKTGHNGQKCKTENCACELCHRIEMCPHCDIPLVYRMHDIDGVNLVETNTCPNCRYGTPAVL